MQPMEFLAEVVKPNLDELNQNYGSLRHAFNAIAAVDALAARMYQWCKIHKSLAVSGISDDTRFREDLAKNNVAFQLLRDLAKAQKHAFLIRGSPLVEDVNKIVSRGVGIGEFRIGQSRIGDVMQVIVELAPGDIHHIEIVVGDALEFLKKEMYRLGII